MILGDYKPEDYGIVFIILLVIIVILYVIFKIVL